MILGIGTDILNAHQLAESSLSPMAEASNAASIKNTATVIPHTTM